MIAKIFNPQIKIREYTPIQEPTPSEVTTYTLSPEERQQIIEKYGEPTGQQKHRKLAKPREIKLCCIDGCNEKSRTKNMCNVHYTRYRIYGDPLFLKRAPKHEQI